MAFIVRRLNASLMAVPVTAAAAVSRAIESNRFVTGVTWVDGELWHGTWENNESESRHIDPQTGTVLERLGMPAGTAISGIESDGGDRSFCAAATAARSELSAGRRENPTLPTVLKFPLIPRAENRNRRHGRYSI